MPINEQNDLQNPDGCHFLFLSKTHNRISYEYIALKGFNDTIEDAKRLIKLCHRFPVRVNVIEYNPIEEGGFEKSEEDTINQFARIVRESGVMITVRRSRVKTLMLPVGSWPINRDDTINSIYAIYFFLPILLFSFYFAKTQCTKKIRLPKMYLSLHWMAWGGRNFWRSWWFPCYRHTICKRYKPSQGKILEHQSTGKEKCSISMDLVNRSSTRCDPGK